MAKVRVPYYTVIGGRGYWRPTRTMRREGFHPVPCGPDGPTAWAVADKQNKAWQAHRAGQRSPTEKSYPLGTMGEAFARYRRTLQWAEKASRTRENWHRAWAHIDPMFGDVAPMTIALEHVERWRDTIRRKHGPHEAFNAIKIWRALWKVMTAFRYVTADGDPSKGFPNSAPAGRSATFSEGETVRLVKAALRRGQGGLACIVAVCWDASFAPVDTRTLVARDMAEAGRRLIFTKARGKTDVAAIGTLSMRTERLVRAYLATRPALLPEAPLFVTEKGAIHSRTHLAKLFRGLLAEVFPAGDKRKLMDMRRSGAVEANAGDVAALALSAKMANSLASSTTLQNTYLPKRLATIQAVDEARRRGRRRLRGNGK